jgi:hypothetical protein
MKYSTVEDVIASFLYPVLPTFQGEPDYQIIHAARKFLQENSRRIDTHLGGGTLGHLGIIISDSAYALISTVRVAGPTLWRSPRSPGRALFKLIQDCADYSDSGGVLIGHPQQINVGYAKIFATGHFMSACRRWNEKHAIEKTWTQFKSHVAAARRQHKKMQGESAATAGYHSTNAAVSHNEDQMAEASIGALTNITTATAVYRGVVAFSHRPIPVLPSSWRTTQTSYGNSRP